MSAPSDDTPVSVESARSAETAPSLPPPFLRGQVDLLKQHAEGDDPRRVLHDLIELVETVVDNVYGSVMHYRPDADQLAVVAAPNLPASYVEEVDGLPVGPSEGSCGTAAWNNEDVITEDIERDSRWTAYRDLARSHGIRACWSIPLADSDGDLLGTFAFYRSEPGRPTAEEYLVLEESSHLASLVLGRARREKALQETRERHLNFLQEVPSGVYRTTPGGQILYANAALIDMMGAESIDELQQTDVSDWYAAGNQRETFKAEMETRGTVEQRETRLKRFDGGTIDVMESARTVRDDAGNVQYYEGIIQDITRRKEAQRALRESEKKLRTILENAQPIFFMLDPDGTFVVSEGADLETIGLEPGEAVGHSIYELYGDSPEIIEEIERTLGGEPVRFTSEVDGRYFETWCTPYYDDHGTLLGCIGMSTDETERRNAQAQLRETKNFYEQVLDQHPTELAVFDRDARYQYVNSQAIADPEIREWIVGHTNEEYCRHRNFDPAIGRRRDDTIREVARSHEPARFEETLEGEEETLHYVRVLVPVADLEGRVTHVVGCGLDVTERVHYEQALREAKEQAEEASHLKSAMLANMSHEVRTPLTAITGFAEVLKTEETDADVQRFANLIVDSGRRLMDTLDSVLQLSKLEAGARSLERQPVDLVKEAKIVITEQKARSEADGIDLRVEATEGHVTGYCDKTAVQRILMNLVSNSVKFTDSGGEVVVRVEQDNGQAYLEVEDTGIGMSEAFQDEMFEAFKQESAGLDREYEGSGLGLSLVKELIDRHGGSLDAESAQGEGTTMMVHLPLHRD